MARFFSSFNTTGGGTIAIMRVKDEEKQATSRIKKKSDVDLTDWLWGGQLGGKGTVLVFRSCVLAPKEKTYPYSTKNSFNTPARNSLIHINTQNDILDEPAHRNSSTLPKTSQEIPGESEPCVQNGEEESVANHTTEWECKTIDDSDASTETSVDADTTSFSCECPDVKKKRDIRDVLNDINKITLKRKLNVINTTADAIKMSLPAQHPSSDEDNDSGHETESPKSLLKTVHKNKKKPEESSDLKSFQSSSSKDSVVSSTVSKNTPDISLDYDSTYSDIYSKDYRDIKVPEKSQMPASLMNLTYKTAMTETKLLSRILHAHGFQDALPHSKDFSLLWTGLHPKPDLLRSLAVYQRVNHFPR